MMRIRLPVHPVSLRTRLLGAWVLSVLVAVGAVVVAALVSTQLELRRYAEAKQTELRAVTSQFAAETGRRVIVRVDQGQVEADSADQLFGDFSLPVKAPDDALPPLPPDPPKAPVVISYRATQPASDEAAALPKLAGLALPLPQPLDPEQVFATAVVRALVLGVVLGGGLAALLACAFAQRILRPIDDLTDAARRLRTGQLDQRVAESGDAELVQLGQAFNRMAESLARTEQLRRTLVTDIAHELRTPLSNVRGYLEALEDGLVEPSPAVLGCLREETALLAQLVDDLQDLSLAEAGKLALHCEPLAVEALLGSTVQALGAQASAKGLRLAVEAAPDLPPALADARRIGQVLRNLVGNAITHTPPGGTITLSAQPAAEGGVAIAVRDTGRGIPASHLPHVFERFYRVDHSRARATGGAGLGLAIVRQFLRAHGSDVSIESAVGQGTTVRFTLAAA